MTENTDECVNFHIRELQEEAMLKHWHFSDSGELLSHNPALCEISAE